jgi:chromosome segregation ATPase
MTILSITAAAQATGVARSTIHRAIKEGRLAVTTQQDGSKGVDIVELIRVFGELQHAPESASSTVNATKGDCSESVAMLQDATVNTVAMRQGATVNTVAMRQDATVNTVAMLHAQIASLQAQLDEAKARLNEAKERIAEATEREKWLQGMLSEQQRRLLPPPKQRLLDRFVEAIQRLRQKG